jgi:hypothetical protein
MRLECVLCAHLTDVVDICVRHHMLDISLYQGAPTLFVVESRAFGMSDECTDVVSRVCICTSVL